MNEPRTAAVLEAMAREAATLDADRRVAFDDDAARVPDGPPEARVAAMSALLREHLGADRGLDVARLRVAVAGAEATGGGDGEPLLFIAGRFTGLFARAFGSDDRRAMPDDIGALVGRTWELAGVVADARRRLLSAAGADETAVLLAGGARFLLLVGDSPEVRERVLAERAALERDFLIRFEGDVVPVVSLVSASTSALHGAELLASGLADAERAQARTPFAGALAGDDAFGPFGEMTDDASFETEFARTRALGERLRGTRFAIGRPAEGVALAPHPDIDSMAEAATAAGDDESLVAVWPGTREGLRQLLELSARVGGRLVVEPAPLLPVWSASEEKGPLAAVFARVDGLDAFAAGGAAEFADVVSVRRRVDELLRVGAAGLAQGRSISILFGGGDDLLACGPLRAVLLFIQRLEERLRETFGAGEPTLSSGVAVASRFARRGTDVARIARQARDACSAAIATGPGRTSALGAVCSTREVGRLVALGDDLVRLAHDQPGVTKALLETAVRVGEGGEPMPLSMHERLRARVHELSARLGLHARNIDGGSDEIVSDGLKTLVREFPAMFGSGVARVPLAYAVLLSEEVEA